MGVQKSIESYIGSDTTVIVHFTYIPGDIEILYPNDKAQPGTDPEIEITAVWTTTGDDLLGNLNEACLDDLQAICFEYMEDQDDGD